MREAVVLLILLLAGAAAAETVCVGDCNDDMKVEVAELVRAVGIAQGRAPSTSCVAADADGDGAVTIDELVAAVDSSLGACSTGPRCGDGSVDPGEECDDGNRVSGDGCDAVCQLEPGGDPCAGVASTAGTDLALERVAAGLDFPLHVNAPPLDPRRLFIVEQGGRILLLVDGVLQPQPFLSIPDRISCCGERGLLSIAFHPDYERNGRFFVDYTNRQGDTVIARYRVSDDPNRADLASEVVLLTIDQPYPNHNGGQLAFGPDGYLYVGMGDGGSGGDPMDNAQSDGTLLGKLLRIDVDVDAPPYWAAPPDNPAPQRQAPFNLIWAKGLRNPWRFSFDRDGGNLYIADVGQGEIEEIDVQSAGSPGGENYGWRIFEGSRCFNPSPEPTCPDPRTGFHFPVTEYTHADGCSVTGGFVYRGCALPDLHGTYFYSDYCVPFLRSFVLRDGVATEERDWTADIALPAGTSLDAVSSFGEDVRGELYIVDYGFRAGDGEVYRLVPSSLTASARSR